MVIRYSQIAARRLFDPNKGEGWLLRQEYDAQREDEVMSTLEFRSKAAQGNVRRVAMARGSQEAEWFAEAMERLEDAPLQDWCRETLAQEAISWSRLATLLEEQALREQAAEQGKPIPIGNTDGAPALFRALHGCHFGQDGQHYRVRLVESSTSRLRNENGMTVLDMYAPQEFELQVSELYQVDGGWCASLCGQYRRAEDLLRDYPALQGEVAQPELSVVPR